MLQVLPSHISNLIAAGEVIQRPASVVKELMENSVDAKATSISVIINDYGKTLIQVIDNGVGMNPQEAALCFQRHATSKISKAEDLYSINTFGFRGEALASIAACAEVTLKTKKEGDQTATEIKISENKINSISQTSASIGCNIAVRNLFYNVPARRKFLKSDSYEYRQIVQEFSRVALTRIDIEFKLIHNSKEIFILPPSTNTKQRILQIAGKELNKDLVEVQTNTSIINVSGYIGIPQNAKKSQNNQYFFVNNRFFKSSLLHKAVLKAYNNLIPDNTSPAYFIFLEVNSQDLDVNIHPSKTEIKFENEAVIFDILNAAVKESIGENAFAPAIDFDMEGVPEIPIAPNNFYIPKAPKIDYDPLFNPFEEEKKIIHSKWNSSSEWKSEFPSQDDAFFEHQGESNYIGKEEKEIKYYSSIDGENSAINDESSDRRSLFILKGRYIVTPVRSGLLLVDICRAKERVLYDRYIEKINTQTVDIQENLYPQTMDLDHDSFILLCSESEKLKTFGFDIRAFGENCIVMYGTPAILKGESVSIEELVDNLLVTLKDFGRDFEQDLKANLALKLVKSAAISATTINNTEAQIIIDSLFACKEPQISPTGEKCMTIISLEELLKKL